MDQLSRSFGMPSFFSPGAAASLFDLPAAAAELPAMPAMANLRSLAVDIKDVGGALEIHADVPGM